MKGILLPHTGDASVLQYQSSLPTPTPDASSVLIRNSYIGINYIDTYFRTGLYPSPKPEILGREGAGTIVSLGSPSDDSKMLGLREGDPVVWMGTGGYAEYTAVPAEKVLKIPGGISERDACAACLQGLTALTLVEEAYPVQSGDWVLVLAATGGVGGWLCQVLRAKGARAIATVSTQEKVAEAKRLGAEVVVVEKEGEVERVVEELTGGKGVKASFDGVGKATFERSLQVTARKGTVVSFGNASGAVEPFSLTKLSAKNLKLVRPSLPNYIVTREEYESYADELWRLMIKEKFDVRVHKTYALKDAAQAQTDLESRKTMGKLLMTP